MSVKGEKARAKQHEAGYGECQKAVRKHDHESAIPLFNASPAPRATVRFDARKVGASTDRYLPFVGWPVAQQDSELRGPSKDEVGGASALPDECRACQAIVDPDRSRTVAASYSAWC